jgi:glycosyltransferase involved in cell wall biosynthesis
MIIGIDASRANHNQRTGVEEYAFQLVQHLKKVIPVQVGVVLYVDKPLQGELAGLPNNWTQKVLNWPPFGSAQGKPNWKFWTQIRLSWEMLWHAPDVLFIPAHVFSLIHPSKTVMTIHDIAAITFPQSYNWFERWYSVWSAKYAVRKLWQVIVPSEFTKNELTSAFGLQTTEKIKVVSHGYDKRYTIGDKNIEDINKILIKYNLAGPYLLSVGRLEEKKNIVNVIKAFEKVRLQTSDFRLQLLLVGKPGYGYEKIKQAIASSPYKSDIITPGYVDDEDLPYLFAGAKVFVFPSLSEGFGLPVLEAMACGCPVVAGSGSASVEVGGEACLYANPLNAQEIASATQQALFQRSVLSAKGLARVGQFSWNKCAEETARLLLQA